MTNKKKKTILRFLWPAIAVIAVFFSGYLLYRGLVKQEISDISLQAEEKVKEVLLEVNLTPEQVVGQYQTEKESSLGRWIKYTKVISANPEEFTYIKESLADEIEKVSKEINLKSSQKGFSARISLSFKGKIVNEINFSFPARNRLAIVVDDLGNSRDINNFLDLEAPLTFAIMPNLPYSSYLAAELKKRGLAYILHMPMEPESYPENNPGEPALFTNMSKAEIEKALERALKSVKGVRGLNNHMGSKFTADKESMNKLMEILSSKGLYFVDSNTSNKSAAAETAADHDVPLAANEFFLDNQKDYEYISGRMKVLKKTVLSQPDTVAICHVTRKNTARALAEFIPRFKEAGIEFVTVREMLK
ncbi:MAG: divergent polysaccharide deacetylase family protein [Elusimicrobiota bacterium]|nr:divergent polysaccharide deacetylase family protein [Elusimicrobiota bacterium]